MMIRKGISFVLFSALFLALTSCKGTFSGHAGPDGVSGEGKVDIDILSGTTAGSGKSLGRGSVKLDGMDEPVKGELFDTDGDGQPDRFKPDEGQSVGNKTIDGQTDGTTWYVMKIEGTVGTFR